ncbi:hypothetical protein GCM10023340_42810 [Nocardioides marinquilinus]|uniref:Uncharacterized protein n=1 Tax=Nocardioides marinquilinus TaxID=1210400 RepID=A0ABP9Q2E5_9ACTN
MSPTRLPPPDDLDPFDLPDALGVGEVTWVADDGLTGHHLHGRLLTDDDGSHVEVACDLLAVDQAYPAPVAGDALRARAHQAWQHGEVHLVAYDGRATLLVPGTRFGAEVVLDAVGRLARALGARPSSYGVRLRLG